MSSQAQQGVRGRRTRRPRQEREREILAAARRVFAERGYQQGSVAEIARRVGVVEGTLYAYFASKRELLVAVLRDFYEPLIREVESGLRAVRGAENRLRFLIASHLSVYVEDLGVCRLVVQELRSDPALYDEAVREMNRRYTGIALDVIEEGMRSGELRGDLAPTVLRDLIYGGIEHALWRTLAGGARVDVSELGEQLADTLLRGALAEEGARDRTAERLERALQALEARVGSAP